MHVSLMNVGPEGPEMPFDLREAHHRLLLDPNAAAQAAVLEGAGAGDDLALALPLQVDHREVDDGAQAALK